LINVGDEIIVQFQYSTLTISDFTGTPSIDITLSSGTTSASSAASIADTEKLDQNYSEMQKDNQELRGIVDSLSRQLQNLERRIEFRK